MLRALFVNENLGGHRTLHHHLRRALSERDDIEAEILDVPPPSFFRRLAGVSIPGLARLDVDLQPLRSQLALSRWVRRQVMARRGTFDVVHVYSQNAGLAIVDLLGSMPSVVSTDSTNEVNSRTLPYREPGRFTDRSVAISRRFEESVFDAATVVVAQSAWAARSLSDDYGFDPGAVPVIPFGIMAPPAQTRLRATPPQITFVGMTMERKGGNRLLRAFERLESPAQLTLITPEAVGARPGVRVENDFTVGDPRLDDELARSTVFALPSEIDKSSYAIVEAMARGVAVLATDIGATDELVDHGVTGLLIPASDDDALASALESMVGDPDRTEAMGRNGRARFEERFDAVETTDALVNTLRRAVAAHSG